MKTILFLCTGNFYRSRFAEIYFNHRAATAGLQWRAKSRGLKSSGWGNVGPLSPYTEKRLDELKIDYADCRHMPKDCEACDLEDASLIVALKEAEHRTMLAERFGGWEDRVTYWHVHDLDAAQPEQALPEIETLVETLVKDLAKRNGSV